MEISERGCQNCILRFQKCFSTFFQIFTMSQHSRTLKKNFHFLAKRFQKGCRTCLYESNRVFWGEKFLLIKISTFYDWSEFGMKTFEHSTKKWVELPKLQFICPAEVFEKKNFLKRIIFIFSLGLPELFLDLLAKNVLVCVLVCVVVGIAKTTLYVSRETFW